MRTKNHIWQFIALSFVLVLITYSGSWAKTYYVDATNGNNLKNGISPESAWSSISKINKMTFEPGDSILFKRGEVWHEHLVIKNSGRQGKPITFGAYGSGNKPVITGDGARNFVVSDFIDRFDPYTVGYIIIENLEVREAKGQIWAGGIDFRGEGIGGPVIIRNCVIKDNKSQGIMMLYDNAVIENNKIMRNGDNGITIHPEATGVLVTDNEIAFNHQGIELLGDNVIIERNHIHHSEYNGLFIEGRPEWEPLGWTGTSADHNTIRYNRFHDNGQGPLGDVTNGAELCNAGGDYNEIYYNLFYNGSPTNAVGIWFDFWVSYNKVYNNVIYNMNTAKQGWGITIETAIDPPSQYPHQDLHGQKAEFNVIKNNVISDCRILLALADDWVTMHDHVFENNCYYVGSGKHAIYDGRVKAYRTVEDWQASSGNPDSHSISANPKLANPSNGDFHLMPSSPCINKGANVNLIEDFDGNQVPYGIAADIGAFEWSDRDLTPPNPPQNVKVKPR